jgi:hypothetical protein
MTEQEALERLHAAVPREVAISLHRNTSVFARMHHPPGRLPLRRVPIESETAEHWTVALFIATEGEGDVVRSGTAQDLGTAVQDAIAKFDAWRKASASRPEPAAPPRLTAPGAAERERMEEQERQRRERDAS